MPKIFVAANPDGVVVRQSPIRFTGGVEVDDPTFHVMGSTLSGTVLTARAAVAASVGQVGRINTGYLRWIGEIRNPNWPDVAADREAGRAAIIGTNKWVYQQAAIGFLLATGQFRDAEGNPVGDAETIETSIEQIEWAMTTLAPIWYRVIRDNAGARAVWSGASTADGALLYSDIIGPDGVAVDRATIAGQFVALAGNVIPARFDPEIPALIRPAS